MFEVDLVDAAVAGAADAGDRDGLSHGAEQLAAVFMSEGRPGSRVVPIAQNMPAPLPAWHGESPQGLQPWSSSLLNHVAGGSRQGAS